jgi:hypothetical protein
MNTNRYRFSGFGSSSGGGEVVATNEADARHISMTERWGERPSEWDLIRKFCNPTSGEVYRGNGMPKWLRGSSARCAGCEEVRRKWQGLGLTLISVKPVNGSEI